MEKQLLNFFKKYYLSIIIVLSSIILLGSFGSFFLSQRYKGGVIFNNTNLKGSGPEEKKEEAEELVYPEELKAGGVGEEGNTPPLPIKEAKDNQEGTPEEKRLSYTVFNTTGVILEVQKDSILVKGSGSNFTDGKERIILLKFTAKTVVRNPQSGISWNGFESLSHLKPDMEILISGAENIRGKTEFIVRAINIL